MGDLLIRNVPAETLDSLKLRAKQHGRSLQAEALEALQKGAEPIGVGLVAWLRTIRNENIDVDAGLRAIREARDER